MAKVLHIMSHYSKSCNLSCTTYQQIKIIDRLTFVPQRYPFFSKSLQAVFKRQNIHLLNEGVGLFQVFFYAITSIGPKK